MSKFKKARRMAAAPYSGIRAMTDIAAQLEKEGKPVIHLEIGDPDFDTPKHIVEHAKAALDAGMVHYSPIAGYDYVLEAICENYKKKYGLEYKKNNVIVTAGITHGIFLAMMAYLDPGDEILLPDPGFPAYPIDALVAEAVPVYYPLNGDNEFQILPGSLDDKITDKTKMILLNSPSNPCGFALNEDSLKEVARVAEEHNLIIISDEVYDQIMYDGKTCMSIACLPGMKERTIVLNGVTKYYSMMGWRCGFVLAPDELMDPIFRLSFYSISCPNSFVQDAAAYALTADDAPSREMVAEYQRRRDYLYEALNDIKGLSCPKADSTFYVFFNCKGTGMTSEELCKYAARECYVVMTPGSAFGEEGEGFVRISYGTSMEKLQEGMKRLKALLEKE